MRVSIQAPLTPKPGCLAPTPSCCGAGDERTGRRRPPLETREAAVSVVVKHVAPEAWLPGFESCSATSYLCVLRHVSGPAEPQSWSVKSAW